MIPFFFSLSGRCLLCRRTDYTLSSETEKQFSELVVGLKPTAGLNWDKKEVFLYSNTEWRPDRPLQQIKAYGVCEVKFADYAVCTCCYAFALLIFNSVCLLFILQGNFTASLTTATACLAMLRERGLLPPLLQSHPRYLFFVLFFFYLIDDILVENLNWLSS